MSHSILIVEDDNELRNIYASILKRVEEYQISEAANGAIALDMLAKNQYHLMILDMLMPNVSGEMVLKRLQQMPQHQDMSVLVTTAYGSFERNLEQYGIDRFLTKPVRPEELLNTVKDLLGIAES